MVETGSDRDKVFLQRLYADFCLFESDVVIGYCPEFGGKEVQDIEGSRFVDS